MNLFETAGILVLVFTVGIAAWSQIAAQASFAPWIPSSTAMAARAFEMLKPHRGMTLADLGCGDGRILFHCYRTYGMSADGYEISLVPFFIGRLRLLAYRKAPIRILRRDLFTADLSGYDIVYIYGLPRSIKTRLVPKLQHEMKKGSRLISYNFSLSGITPIAEFHDRWRNVFVYQF